MVRKFVISRCKIKKFINYLLVQIIKENCLIKSRYFSKKTNMICLADDSGLEIDCLNKKPGIYSARWSGKHGDFKKAIKKVYKELKKKKLI